MTQPQKEDQPELLRGALEMTLTEAWLLARPRLDGGTRIEPGGSTPTNDRWWVVNRAAVVRFTHYAAPERSHFLGVGHAAIPDGEREAARLEREDPHAAHLRRSKIKWSHSESSGLFRETGSSRARPHSPSDTGPPLALIGSGPRRVHGDALDNFGRALTLETSGQVPRRERSGVGRRDPRRRISCATTPIQKGRE
jgi:hypothetical protein